MLPKPNFGVFTFLEKQQFRKKNMKKITLFLLLLLIGLGQNAFARDGYHIKLKLTGADDSEAYLAYYYAKGLPTIYKADSAKIKNGVAVFDNKENTIGGIYIILLSDQKTYLEFLLNNGDNIGINMSVKDLPYSVTFDNSTENENFQEYEKFLKAYGDEQQKLQKEYADAKTKSDSTETRQKLNDHAKQLTEYRKEMAKKHSNTLLASIFRALELPVVPQGTHYLADGKTVDSTFSYTYYKDHYWDGFNFQDDRLIHTPIYEAKITEYFNRLTYPTPDSIDKEADMLLTKTRGTKELFKYTLDWIKNFSLDSKIMGMDVVFVYLVENYYMKGDATWLSNDDLSKYIDRASKIMPNVIGNVAPEIKMPDINGKEQSLSEVKAKYTLVVFWSPECGHCQHEIPLVDSVYRAVLKAKGVKVFAVRTEGDEKKWKEFIDKNNLGDWINVWDPDHTREDFRPKYDVYSTPIIYLLDEKKIIRGKKLDHTNITQVIDMIEQKDKTTKVKS